MRPSAHLIRRHLSAAAHELFRAQIRAFVAFHAVLAGAHARAVRVGLDTHRRVDQPVKALHAAIRFGHRRDSLPEQRHTRRVSWRAKPELYCGAGRLVSRSPARLENGRHQRASARRLAPTAAASPARPQTACLRGPWRPFQTARAGQN